MSSYQPTETDIVEFKEAFALFDKDSDGVIATGDLGSLLRALSQNPTEAELHAMEEEIDPQSCGTFDITAFVALLARQMQCSSDEEDLLKDVRSVFAAHGGNDDGSIPLSRLRRAMGDLFQKLYTTHLSEAEIDDMFSLIENSRHVSDNRITAEEFLSFLVNAT